MSTPKAKPFKLKPSDGAMTRDDVSLWEYTLLAACRQITEWQQFLPEGAHATWAATDTDPTNNLTVQNAGDNAANVAATTKLRNDFKNFLTCVATHCPTGFMDTVMRVHLLHRYCGEDQNYVWIGLERREVPVVYGHQTGVQPLLYL